MAATIFVTLHAWNIFRIYLWEGGWEEFSKKKIRFSIFVYLYKSSKIIYSYSLATRKWRYQNHNFLNSLQKIDLFKLQDHKEITFTILSCSNFYVKIYGTLFWCFKNKMFIFLSIKYWKNTITLISGMLSLHSVEQKIKHRIKDEKCQ